MLFLVCWLGSFFQCDVLMAVIFHFAVFFFVHGSRFRDSAIYFAIILRYSREFFTLFGLLIYVGPSLKPVFSSFRKPCF